VKERDFIAQIRNRFSNRSEYLIQGIGDDCAVFADSTDFCWLVTTDVLVDTVHFVRDWHDPYLLGRKSIAVNLSDIAAMAGQPRFVLISLSIPSHISDSWLELWHSGAESMLQEHGCVLIGGDTSSSSVLTVNVMVIGSARPEKVLYRSGAGIGHDIYVTGPLGSSAAGLELLKRGWKNSKYSELIKAHLDPQPRVKTGEILGDSGLLSAMQDISDGVATDLSHICAESNVGAVLYADKLPYERELIGLCGTMGLDLHDIVLGGGEDYELLFTAESANREKLDRLSRKLARPFFRIGRTVRTPGDVFLEENGLRKNITFGGFEHCP
jgi:thiamine-monophosphate kinase